MLRAKRIRWLPWEDASEVTEARAEGGNHLSRLSQIEYLSVLLSMNLSKVSLTDISFLPNRGNLLSKGLIHRFVLHERGGFIHRLCLWSIWNDIMQRWPEYL